MKKFLIVLLFTVLISPVSYQTWKSNGNYFWGGFEGFANYYTWLTPEHREIYKSEGEFKGFGSFGNKKEDAQSVKQWRKENGIDGSRGFKYIVE